MKRIIKLGVGAERPGEIVYEAHIQAEQPADFASQIKGIWAQYSAQVELLQDEETFLHLVVEEEETGWADFDLEDAIIELLDD